LFSSENLVKKEEIPVQTKKKKSEKFVDKKKGHRRLGES